MPIGGSASLTRGRAAIEEHFQPEAGNKVLKGFELKLTPMASRPPYFQFIYAYLLTISLN